MIKLVFRSFRSPNSDAKCDREAIPLSSALEGFHVMTSGPDRFHRIREIKLHKMSHSYHIQHKIVIQYIIKAICVPYLSLFMLKL